MTITFPSLWGSASFGMCNVSDCAHCSGFCGICNACDYLRGLLYILRKSFSGLLLYLTIILLSRFLGSASGGICSVLDCAVFPAF
eukprot:Awhi_evm3s15566